MPGVNYTLDLKTGGFTSGINSALSGVGALGGKILGLAGIASAVAGALAGVKKAVGGASALETTTIAFETLLGSAAKAKTLLADLKKLGSETPFEFPELADAGRKLVAFGEAGKNVPAVLRRIGDVAAAVQAPIAEIAEIYGKARVQGTLFAEDINQLTGRGIPVIQEFARILGTSEGAVKKLAAEGKITFPMLEKAFSNLTTKGGKFSGMMAKQSETTAGLWSTLKDAINEVFTSLGKPLNDALRPMLKNAIEIVGKVQQAATEMISTLRAAVQEGALGDLLKSQLIRGLKEGGNFLNALMRGLGAGLMEWATGMWESLRKLPEFLYAAGMNLLSGAQVLLKGDFWNGVALQFTSIGLRFAAAVGDSLMPVIERITELINQVRSAFGKAPIDTAGLKAAFKVGDLLSGAADSASAKSYMKAVSSVRVQQGPQFDSAEVMLGRVVNAFAEAFNTGPDAFNTRGEEEAWNRWKDLGSLQRKKDEKESQAAEKQEKAAGRQALAADNISRAAKLMERLFGAGEEGRGRIKTYDRAESATRRFLRRSKADRDGSLSDFLGPIDADLGTKVGANLNLARLHRASNKPGSNANANQEKILSRIDDNTRTMAQHLGQLQPA